jgi:hypothetical protein
MLLCNRRPHEGARRWFPHKPGLCLARSPKDSAISGQDISAVKLLSALHFIVVDNITKLCFNLLS